jgi:F-type H+-transporting ATPase subunit epsilon
VADTFRIEIATPERLLASEDAVRAQVPLKNGFIGVLPDHAPLLSELGIGALTYVTPGDHKFSVAIKAGFCEILNNCVRILSDQAERGHEIDEAQAQRDLRQAEQEVLNPAVGIDIASALSAYFHAQARIEAARKEATKEE